MSTKTPKTYFDSAMATFRSRASRASTVDRFLTNPYCDSSPRPITSPNMSTMCFSISFPGRDRRHSATLYTGPHGPWSTPSETNFRQSLRLASRTALRYSARLARCSSATNTLSTPLHRWKRLRAERVAAFSLSNSRVHHPALTLGARRTGIDADAARTITLSRLTTAASTSSRPERRPVGSSGRASLSRSKKDGPIGLRLIEPTLLSWAHLYSSWSPSDNTKHDGIVLAAEQVLTDRPAHHPANRPRRAEGDVYVRTATCSSPKRGNLPNPVLDRQSLRKDQAFKLLPTLPGTPVRTLRPLPIKDITEPHG
ncbi:unnamed protein product [Nesidiocoris tenuis]|uniref:Uncharacterized protein n=1 Tax=Nesidiocoris tenuis TaxID=355587 RepID=A0A6H5H7G2_9HEMI|nr:unnamed protein product [Nesidiocoris tenuis]